jgi:hypothetical protein
MAVWISDATAVRLPALERLMPVKWSVYPPRVRVKSPVEIAVNVERE